MVHRMLTSVGSEECDDIYAIHQFISAGDTVFDIGANNGAYTKAMSKLVGPHGHVYAFEPIPHNLDILRTMVSRLGLNNVTVLPIALGDTRGQLPMTIPEVGFGGGYSLCHFSSAGEPSNCTVECDTLDSLISRGVVGFPSFIKCDVEGAEKQVMDGASRLITDHHPGWLLETYEDGMFDTMHTLGYRSFVYEIRSTFEPAECRQPNARNYYFLTAPPI